MFSSQTALAFRKPRTPKVEFSIQLWFPYVTSASRSMALVLMKLEDRFEESSARHLGFRALFSE